MKLRPLALALAAAVLLPAAAQAQEVTFKVSHFLPPTSAAQTMFIEPWCNKIEEESKGRMKCQIYASMSLGGTPPQLINQVRDGVADIIWTLPGYTAGRFPASEVFELPFITADAEAGSRAFWDFMQTKAKKELNGVYPIATWINGPNVMHFRDKEVKSLADLKNMKVRAPSRQGTKLLAALGATPVGMPVPQMAESLSKGVIEGALIPWEVVPATKTHELTRYHLDTGEAKAMVTSTMLFVMNQKKYDKLPADLKKIIDDNSGRETSAWVAARFKEANVLGVKATNERGNTINTLSEADVQVWEKAAEPVVQDWVKEVSGKGLNGQELLDEARALVQKYAQ